MKKVVCLIIALTVASLCFAEDDKPYTFAGIPWGITVPDLKARMANKSIFSFLKELNTEDKPLILYTSSLLKQNDSTIVFYFEKRKLSSIMIQTIASSYFDDFVKIKSKIENKYGPAEFSVLNILENHIDELGIAADLSDDRKQAVVKEFVKNEKKPLIDVWENKKNSILSLRVANAFIKDSTLFKGYAIITQYINDNIDAESYFINLVDADMKDNQRLDDMF
jgi:hypothetical protein|nr:MAG TPA: hypothetical protein [Caudoviricetes sp.]